MAQQDHEIQSDAISQHNCTQSIPLESLVPFPKLKYQPFKLLKHNSLESDPLRISSPAPFSWTVHYLLYHSNLKSWFFMFENAFHWELSHLNRKAQTCLLGHRWTLVSFLAFSLLLLCFQMLQTAFRNRLGATWNAWASKSYSYHARTRSNHPAWNLATSSMW